uniref:non-specific serine/threonine protein kinase n=1 Tax=Strigamia maritima TaxID=126957 RepID=T1IIX0_STRMM
MDFSSSDYSFRPSYTNVNSESSNSTFRDSDHDLLVKTTVVQTYGRKNRVVFGDKLEEANSLKKRNVFNNSNEESPGDPFDRLFRNFSNQNRCNITMRKKCSNLRSTASPKQNQHSKKMKLTVCEFLEEISSEIDVDGFISPVFKKKCDKKKLNVKEKSVKENSVKEKYVKERELKLDPRYHQNWNDIENTMLLVEGTSKNKNKPNDDDEENLSTTLMTEESLIQKKNTSTKQKHHNDTRSYGILRKKSVQTTSTPYTYRSTLKPTFGTCDISALTTYDENNDDFDEMDSTISLCKEKNQIKECAVVLTRLKHSLVEKINGPSLKNANTAGFENLCRSFENMSTTHGKKNSSLTFRLPLESDLSDITEETEGAVPPAKQKTSVNRIKSSVSITKHDMSPNKPIKSKNLLSSVLKQQPKRSLSPDFETIFDKSGKTKVPRFVLPRSKELDVRNENFHRRTTLLAALTPHDTSIAGKSICGPSNVLLHCGQEKPIQFSNFLKNYSSIKKIDEGSYGEVFKATNIKKEEIVLKIQPICEGEDNNFDCNWPEVVCTCRLSELRYDGENSTSNFIRVNKVACLQGTFPKPLLKMWDDYADQFGTESDRPNYNSQQKYLGYEIENGGPNLETYRFSSMSQAVSVFLQIAAALAVAEKAVKFEHRDLHWGNILVKDTQESYIAFTFNGGAMQIISHKVRATMIDFGLSRLEEDCAVFVELDKQDIMSGTGDYQFDIYRKMQGLIGNDWGNFYPKTNIMWLHYLVDKLLTSKTYSSRSRAHILAKKQLEYWADEILNYDSASVFVALNSQFFK